MGLFVNLLRQSSLRDTVVPCSAATLPAVGRASHLPSRRPPRRRRYSLVRGQSWSFSGAFLLRFGERNGDIVEGGNVLVNIRLGVLHRHRPLLILPVGRSEER